MKIRNLQEAFKDLLVNQAVMSVYEFGALSLISPLALDKHIKGETNRIQEGTLRKIRDNTKWDFRINPSDNSIRFFEKGNKTYEDTNVNQESSNKNNEPGDLFYVKMSEADKEWLELIQGFDEKEKREWLKLMKSIDEESRDAVKKFLTILKEQFEKIQGLLEKQREKIG